MAENQEHNNDKKNENDPFNFFNVQGPDNNKNKDKKGNGKISFNDINT